MGMASQPISNAFIKVPPIPRPEGPCTTMMGRRELLLLDRTLILTLCLEWAWGQSQAMKPESKMVPRRVMVNQQMRRTS